MNIDFCGPAVPAQDGGISYRVKIDGETVACEFTMEVLQDIEPSKTDLPAIHQFEASQNSLLDMAQEKISKGLIVNGVVLITTSDL